RLGARRLGPRWRAPPGRSCLTGRQFVGDMTTMPHLVFVRTIIASTLAAFPAAASAQGTRPRMSDSLPSAHADSSRATASFHLVSTRDAWMVTGAVLATAS